MVPQLKLEAGQACLSSSLMPTCILQEVQRSGHAADVLSKWVQVSLACKAAEQSAIFHWNIFDFPICHAMHACHRWVTWNADQCHDRMHLWNVCMVRLLCPTRQKRYNLLPEIFFKDSLQGKWTTRLNSWTSIVTETTLASQWPSMICVNSQAWCRSWNQFCCANLLFTSMHTQSSLADGLW